MFALDPGATMNEPWKLKSDLARSLLSVSDLISDKDFNVLFVCAILTVASVYFDRN